MGNFSIVKRNPVKKKPARKAAKKRAPAKRKPIAKRKRVAKPKILARPRKDMATEFVTRMASYSKDGIEVTQSFVIDMLRQKGIASQKRGTAKIYNFGDGSAVHMSAKKISAIKYP